MKKHKRSLRIVVLSIAATALAGCATPYQDFAVVGDTEEAIIEQLGKPAERIVKGDFTGVQYSSSGFKDGEYNRQDYTIIFYGNKLFRQGYGLLREQDGFPPLLIDNDGVAEKPKKES